MRIRIFALARDLGLDSKLIIECAEQAGVKLRNALATITEEERDNIVAFALQRGIAPDPNVRLDDIIRSAGGPLMVKQLSMSNLAMDRVPERLRELLSLEVLDLKLNRLQSLPSWLPSLANLRSIDLDNNLLESFHLIPKLSSLESVSLKYNHLTVIATEVFSLPFLRTLNLSGNRLQTIPSTVAFAGKLETFNIGDNQIRNLPAEIFQPPCLRALFAFGNQLRTLPQTIAHAKRLEVLDVRNNDLENVPEEMAGLQQLQKLLLHNNPQLAIPVEVQGEEDKPRSPRDILRFLFAPTTTRQKRRLMEAKVILVGQGNAGKTSIVRRLISDEFDPREVQTDGIEVSTAKVEIHSQSNRLADRSNKKFKKFRHQKANAVNERIEHVRVNFWDFGGQEILHSTHQFFLTQRSLYLLVLNARSGEQEGNIHYWLRIIQTFGGDAPVLVVVNHAESPHYLELDERRILADYAPNVVGFLTVSCKTGVGIDELAQEIRKQIRRMEHVFDRLPESFFEVKREIEERRKSVDFLSREAFQMICSRTGVRDTESQQLLLRFLHDLGTILCYDDPKQQFDLHDTNVLNPEWVTTGVYRIITNHSFQMEKTGKIKAQSLRALFQGDSRYPGNRIRFLIDLMRKFDLCFSLSDNVEDLLVPELLGVNEPDVAWGAESSIRFEIHYDILPRGLMPRFIVRTHHLLTERPTYWRAGVVLAVEGCRVLVRGDLRKNIVYLEVQGDEANARRRALAIVRDHFRVVHSAYSRLGPCEKVPLPFEPDAEPVEFAFLCELEKKGKLTHEFPRCREAVNIRHLLNGIDEAHFDIFLSFSGTDRGLVKATHRELLANGIRAWIDDENLEGGSLWAIHIPDAIAKSRCIAVFIGPEGIRSWGKEEYLLAVTEAVVNGKTVIPVRLPGSVRMEGLPAEFGFLKQRQCIDFSDGVSECGIAQLIKAILNS